MEEDEDDLYQQQGSAMQNGHDDYADDDEGEDMEEDSDSDIDIITERKPDAPKPEPSLQHQQPQPQKHAEPTKPESTAHLPAQAADKPTERSSTPQATSHQRYSAPQSSKPGSDYPAVHTSSLNIDAPIPDYEPAGKPLTDLDFDADLAEHTKPWRLPGTDPTDYFNYGFDEFTWATYCLKQQSMRETIADQKAESAKFEMMWGGNLPGMPGQLPAAAQPPQQPQPASQPQQGQAQQQQQQQQPQAPAPPQNPAMPGMPNMPPMPGMGMPEMTQDMMNQMMQQMMASGMDPMQMDFGTFMQQMSSMQQGAPAIGAMPGNQQSQQGSQAFGGGQPQVYGSGGGGGGGGGGNSSGQGSGQQGGGQRRNQRGRW